MPNHWASDRGTIFYVGMAWFCLAVALIGFSTTYILPVAGQRFAGPAVAHVHGGLFFAWVALATAQPMLIRRRLWRWHMRLGWAAIPLALGMAVSGLGVGIYAVRRDFAAGVGEVAVSTLPGVATAMAALLVFAAAGLALRKRADWHKRLMLLATIAVLWPAWFRFRHLLPWVPRPDILLAVIAADSLILVAMARDWVKFGRVHPAYWIGGLGLIADHVIEVIAFDSPPWRGLAHALYAALG